MKRLVWSIASLALFSCDLGEIPVNYHNKILFTSLSGGGTQLYMIDPTGQGRVQLTSGPFDNFDGQWSPDATRLSFFSNEDPSTAGKLLFVMNSDGSGRRSLGVRCLGGSWSPDGNRLAVVLCPGCEGGSSVNTLSIVEANGSGVSVLTSYTPGTGRVIDTSPVWSPDGTRIYFLSNRHNPTPSGSMELYVVNLDGSAMRRITYNDGVFRAGLALAPDGRRIAFSGYVGRPDSGGIYMMNLDTTNTVLLVPNSSSIFVGYPRWSPDGTQLVFLANQHLRLASINGAGVRDLIPDSNVTSCDWSW
jgi:TolB protein